MYKKESLASYLTAETADLGSSALLEINIELTDEGLNKKETVIKHCFDMLSFLNKTGIPEYLFKEANNTVEFKGLARVSQRNIPKEMIEFALNYNFYN